MNERRRARAVGPWLLALGMLLGGSAASAAPAPLPPTILLAESEGFELVGRLQPEGLLLWLDRAESNRPVEGARIEVEAGGTSRVATYRAASQDYLIDDAGWLAPLRRPAVHPVAVTVTVGAESDLLAGALTPPAGEDGAAPGAPAGWIAGIGLVLLALAGGIWRRRRVHAGGAQ